MNFFVSPFLSIFRDNDFLHFGHRPALPSFAECFKSIFRIHTETGNIWTHLVIRLSLIFHLQKQILRHGYVDNEPLFINGTTIGLSGSRFTYFLQ